MLVAVINMIYGMAAAFFRSGDTQDLAPVRFDNDSNNDNNDAMKFDPFQFLFYFEAILFTVFIAHFVATVLRNKGGKRNSGNSNGGNPEGGQGDGGHGDGGQDDEPFFVNVDNPMYSPYDYTKAQMTFISKWVYDIAFNGKKKTKNLICHDPPFRSRSGDCFEYHPCHTCRILTAQSTRKMVNQGLSRISR